MKKFGVLGIGLLALSTACSGGFGGDSPSYSGKIADWPSGKTGTLSVAVSSTVSGTPASVDPSGNFSNLLFPDSATVTPTLTATIPPCTGIVVTPSTVKGTTANFTVKNAAGANAGSVIEANKQLPTGVIGVGNVQVARFYADTAATMKGTCAGSDLTITYDINLSAGWNLIAVEVTSGTANSVNIKASTSGLPGNVKLFYVVGTNPLSISNLFK